MKLGFRGRELWKLKEHVKTRGALKRAFDDNETADGVIRCSVPEKTAARSLQEIDKYKNEYGNKVDVRRTSTSTPPRD